MKRKLTRNLLIAIITTMITAASQANDCSAGHCSRVSTSSVRQCELNAQIIGLTMDEYKKRGGKASTSENGRDCFCPCSCVVAETLIGTPEGYVAIEAIKANDSVLTPLAEQSLGFVSNRLLSSSSDFDVLKTEFSNGESIISSPNHTFITPDETVVSADQLKEGDQVLAADKSVVKITSTPTRGKMDGSLFNLSINRESSKPVDHVIDTNGILSGDWLLQSTNDLVEEELFLRTSVINLFND